MKWFTGDFHIGHENIIKYCDRPFKNIEHMREEIIKRFNQRVKENDTVYFLGDFSFQNKKEREKIYKRLNGKHVFIRGNHDKTGTCPIYSAIIRYGDGHFACICHDPIDRLSPYQVVIHAHVHKAWKAKEDEGILYINVGVDVWNFYPVSITEIDVIARKLDQDKFIGVDK